MTYVEEEKPCDPAKVPHQTEDKSATPVLKLRSPGTNEKAKHNNDLLEPEEKPAKPENKNYLFDLIDVDEKKEKTGDLIDFGESPAQTQVDPPIAVPKLHEDLVIKMACKGIHAFFHRSEEAGKDHGAIDSLTINEHEKISIISLF